MTFSTDWRGVHYFRRYTFANTLQLMRFQKSFALSALILGSIAMVECSPKTGKSTTANLPATTKEDTHYSSAQVAEGKTIYTASCGKCHKLFTPAEKSRERWESVLPPMIKKARLTDEQGALVRAYVMSNL